MKKRIIITVIVIVLSLIMFIILIPLLKRTDVAQFLTQRTPTPQEGYKDNLTKCPQKLWVYYFVDIKDTRTSVKDDDVYITILNKEQDDYVVDVFVDGTLQGEVLSRANSTSQLISELVTDWWRQGFEQPTQAEEETEASSKDEEDLLNQQIFEITLFVEGCDIIEQEALTKVEGPSRITGGGGSGGGEGGGSRYSISITKPEGKILDD